MSLPCTDKHPFDAGDDIGFFSCSNASEFANNRAGCMVELKVVQMKLLSTRFREVERGEDVMISNGEKGPVTANSD